MFGSTGAEPTLSTLTPSLAINTTALGPWVNVSSGSQILHVLMANSKRPHAHVLRDLEICANRQFRYLKISRIIRLFCAEKHFKLGPATASQLSHSSHISAHSQVSHYRPPVSSSGCFFEFDCEGAPARSSSSRVKSKNMHKQFDRLVANAMVCACSIFQRIN